jgi:hypothetical protein
MSTQTSPSTDYPSRRDLFNALIRQLYEKYDAGAVITFEGRTTQGWCHDVLLGRGPFVQIQMRDQQTMLLNLARQKLEDLPPLPATWPQEKRMWLVNREDTEALINWLCRYFTAVSGGDNLKTAGFIES